MSKNCVLLNYIPHRTPIQSDSIEYFEKWFKFYENDLRNMFKMTLIKICERYVDDDIETMETDENFNLFVNLEYDTSSKYISKD